MTHDRYLNTEHTPCLWHGKKSTNKYFCTTSRKYRKLLLNDMSVLSFYYYCHFFKVVHITVQLKMRVFLKAYTYQQEEKKRKNPHGTRGWVPCFETAKSYWSL